MSKGQVSNLFSERKQRIEELCTLLKLLLDTIGIQVKVVSYGFVRKQQQLTENIVIISKWNDDVVMVDITAKSYLQIVLTVLNEMKGK